MKLYTNEASRFDDDDHEVDTGARAKLIGLILLAAFVGLFVAQNLSGVTVDFLFWSVELPRMILMLASAVLGIAMWELGRFVLRRQRSD